VLVSRSNLRGNIRVFVLVSSNNLLGGILGLTD
jgi:hypothetical protein